MWLKNYEIARDSAEAVLELAEAHGFQIWSAVGSCLLGAASVNTGDIDRGSSVDRTRAERISRTQNPSGLLANAPPSLCERIWRSLKTKGWVTSAGRGHSMRRRRARVRAKILTPEFLILKGDLLLAFSSDNAVDAESLYQDAVNNAREVSCGNVGTASCHEIEPLMAESRQVRRGARIIEHARTQKSPKASLRRT